MKTAGAVIFGESHTACIAAAAKTRPNLVPGLSVYRLRSRTRPNDLETVSIEEAERLIAELGLRVQVFLYMLGTYHNIIGLLRHEPEFDFLFEGGDRISHENAVVIPRRIVASLFEAHLAKAFGVLKLKRASSGAVFMLGTPPPKRSNAFIMKSFEAMVKKEYHGKNAVEVGINRPELRLKLWKIEQETVKAWATDLGITYLPTPAASQDDEGYLRESLYGDDATHGNTDYGKLWLEKIRSLAT